jgi:hypothetical protein
MPWSISKRGDEYCVIKTQDDSVEGCHATREEAEAQQRALYASENDAATSTVVFIHEDVPMLLNRAVEALDGPHAPAQVRDWLIEATRLLGSEHYNVPEEDIVQEAEAIVETAAQGALETFAWEGPITYEGLYTGDKRYFKEGAVVWNEELLPFPFKWQRISADGHDASITIGRVDRIFRGEEGAIYGEGVIFVGDGAPSEGEEYVNLLLNGAAGGVSIDGDDAEFEILYEENEDGEIENMRMEFERINVRALTAVDIPAFAGAKIKLTQEALLAAVIGSTDLPVAPRDRRWDGLAAQRGIFAWAESEEGFDTTKLARAFLWRDSEGDPEQKGSYKLPFTELIDGTLTIIPKAVFAAAAAIEGARGGVNIPDADKSGIRHKLGTLYGKINSSLGEGEEPVTPPWESDRGDASIVTAEEFARKRKRSHRYTYNELEAVLASAIPCDPPSDWFNNPEFSELTPITITDEGRISGHLAGLSCHIGYGSCTTPPRGCDYDNYFHLGALKTAEGEEIHVGHMTFGGGHAPTNLSAREAAARYDSTSKVSADIRCGEDEFGTWVVGALRPGLSSEELREVRSAPLSGDWRPVGGKLQLIAAHGVNVPGFPVPRVKALVASGGETQTLIIAAPEECDCVEEEKTFDQLMLEMELEEE